MKRSLISILFIIFILVGLAYFLSESIGESVVPDTLETYHAFIPSGKGLDSIADTLFRQGFIDDTLYFVKLAQKQALKPRGGRFLFPAGTPITGIVDHLKSGKQAPFDLILNGKRTKEEVAGFVSQHLEIDSLTLVTAFKDEEFLTRYNCNPYNVISLFIPNTYEVFWNYSAQQLLDRMYKESQLFWNEERLEKARKIGLNTKEVITLASIIEKETNKDDEKDRIAGVYLNRLKTKGWRLDADPCVIFAWQDFTIRRLTPEIIALDSPYNTYKYAGLPPGPICMPSITTIDETLDAEDHKFMFFCARPDGSGYHDFTKTLKAHKVNARKYKAYFEANNDLTN